MSLLMPHDTNSHSLDADIIVTGAGPAGLSLASALAGSGLRAILIERQPLETLSEAPYDGREIALTRPSVQALRALGIWAHIPQEEVFAIRDARVFNGSSSRCMEIGHRDGGREELGFLVSNHLIRRAAFAAIAGLPQVTLIAQSTVLDARRERDRVRVMLSEDRTLTARLIVAADSRFSELRRKLGISSRARDFGKTMLVCRTEHEKPHDQVAVEWFDHNQTLALLPLKENTCSSVVTVPHAEAQRLIAMPAEHFGEELRQRYRGRLGWMRPVSRVFAYPLIGVMADRFAGERCAMVGDTAVGMHPVTAHGFNLGLGSVLRLARELKAVAAAGRDIGASSVLERYARRHRRAALPLYLTTNAIVSLYTREDLPARFMRHALLRAGQELSPFRRAVARSLSGNLPPWGGAGQEA